MMLDERQAFDAMRAFVRQYAARVPMSEDLQQLSFAIDYDGVGRSGQPLTADPHSWGDWLKAIASAVAATG